MVMATTKSIRISNQAFHKAAETSLYHWFWNSSVIQYSPNFKVGAIRFSITIWAWKQAWALWNSTQYFIHWHISPAPQTKCLFLFVKSFLHIMSMILSVLELCVLALFQACGILFSLKNEQWNLARMVSWCSLVRLHTRLCQQTALFCRFNIL